MGDTNDGSKISLNKYNKYTPKELYDRLSECVIGQDEYLKKVAMTVWLHNKRLQAVENTLFDMHLQKYNLLCVGPTGSGKTLAVNILAELYDLDVLVADMSGYTGTGWKGKDVDQMIKDLYTQCNGDRKRTEHAIVVMDEVDKLILQNNGVEPSFAAENSLLKIVEGTNVTFDGSGGEVTINTSNILFIAAGAFEGIEYLVKQRLNEGKIGFKPVKSEVITDKGELLLNMERADLVKYGMGVQFMGIAVLRELNASDLTDILLHSKASVVRNLNETLRHTCGIEVIMDEGGAKAVAEKAVREGARARGLAQTVLPAVNDVLFMIGNDETINGILLTAQDVEPCVKLLEGERHYRRKRKGKNKVVFPSAKRKNVEHFSWLLLSVYLEEAPIAYHKMHAMHALLCNIVLFILTCCNPNEWNLDSIQKILKEAIPEPGISYTIYEFIMTEGKHYSENQDYVYYYKLFKLLDPDYNTVPLLQQAIEVYVETPEHPQGNVTKHQKVIKKGL